MRRSVFPSGEVPDLPDHLVWPEALAGGKLRRLVLPGRGAEEAIGARLLGKQRLDLPAQVRVAPTRGVEVGLAFRSLESERLLRHT
jgi:hypothetical protein